MSVSLSKRPLDYNTIGERIKQRRKELGLSTEELAKRAAVARYTVIRIERGCPCHTKTLQKIRKVLRLFTDQLTRPLDPVHPFVTHRAEQTKWTISIPKSKYQTRLADDDPIHVDDEVERKRLGDLGFQPFYTAVLESELPGGVMGQALMELHQPSWVDRHFGEEFVYCLRGKVRLTVDGVPCELNAGDALCFDASLPHQYEPLEKADLAPQILVVVAMRRK